ncbi:MAG: hypothetical protein AABX02_02145 [archaeon]
MSVRKKKVSSIQTFDPEDFDIHGVDHSIRRKILPLKRGEPLVKLRRDLKWFKGEEKYEKEKEKRSLVITLFSNFLMPGLGNVYVRSNAFSISILVLSLLVLFTTFSPVFPIVNFLSAANITQPNHYDGTSYALYVPENVVVENQLLLVGPTFSILIVPLLLSWFHLLYLFLNHSHRVAWKW